LNFLVNFNQQAETRNIFRSFAFLLFVEQSNIPHFSSQFRQHFTSSFCTDIFAPKILQNQAVTREKLCKALLYKEALMKC